MSLDFNPNLTNWFSVSLPTALKYFTISNCNLNPSSIQTICANLVSNGATNGNLNLLVNPLLPNGDISSSIASNITTLRGNSWNVNI